MSAALGRVSGALAEQFAYLNSPAAIAGEIARLESLVRGGEATHETHALLTDWRAIRKAQRKFLAAQEGGDE
jgi:hypothetical protein